MSVSYFENARNLLIIIIMVVSVQSVVKQKPKKKKPLHYQEKFVDVTGVIVKLKDKQYNDQNEKIKKE